jgi:TetR/AcrR family transcriptional regulator
MVSRKRDAARSRERLLVAAGAEFAARGFAGAKVDRIAARARLNKAMIYYHFGSKAALYREVLLDVFGTVADAVSAEIVAPAVPDRIREFIRVVARIATSRPHFGPIWLREMAEGGTHIDASIVDAVRRILRVLGDMLEEGAAAGVIRPAQPLIVHFGIVGPLLVFVASATARSRLSAKLGAIAEPDLDVLLDHIENATLGALQVPAGIPSPRAVRTADRRRQQS